MRKLIIIISIISLTFNQLEANSLGSFYEKNSEKIIHKYGKLDHLLIITNHDVSDEEAIKQTCENETRYYHEGDGKNCNNQWAETAYSEYQAQTLNDYIKVPFAKGATLTGLRNSVTKNLKPDGLVSKMTDFESRISGNMAWATYTQEDFKGETSVAKSRQLRILEKINGSWKIVGLSIQRM